MFKKNQKQRYHVVTIFLFFLFLTFLVLGGAAMVGEGPRALAQTDPSTAIVTRKEGEAQLLTPLAETGGGQEGSSQVQLNGNRYGLSPLKAGKKVVPGSVVQTGADGKVRLIFPNGDQVTVAPGTTYENTKVAGSEGKPLFNVFSGQIRAIINKGGPREALEVKTNTTVMGVRGTDFHVASWSAQGGSRVSVLRGKVAVSERLDQPSSSGAPSQKNQENLQNKQAQAPGPVEVSAGQTLTVDTSDTGGSTGAAANKGSGGSPKPKLIIQQTSQEQLLTIQKSSTVPKNPKKSGSDDAPKEAIELESLEKKAVETTLADIAKTDPSLYKVIKDPSKIDDLDTIQTLTIKKAIITAPSSAGSNQQGAKPSLKDLDLDPEDAYDQYQWQP